MAATLGNHRVTSAQVWIPAWGRWRAEVSIDGEVELSGSVELKIADLTLRGTVINGGASKGRSHFRIVAGAGGWGETIPKLSYATDFGVKVSTILTDAARAVGETVSLTTTETVGPAYTRQTGPACALLERLAPGAWYIDEAGVTRLGKRASSALAVQATRLEPVDRSARTVTIAAESIATILPGVIVDGIEAVDVQHEISAENGLRSTIWGATAAATSRIPTALRQLLDQLDPHRLFRGVHEYVVDSPEGSRLNMHPLRVSNGLPPLQRVPMRPGVAGCEATLTPGTRVLVAFVDASPARPVVVGFEDADGDGFSPITLAISATATVSIADGVLPAARMGDIAGGIWPIVGTAVKVLI